MKSDLIQEYTRRISQANRSQIIVIVYELADCYIGEALESYEAGDEEAFTQHCHEAMQCVMHLLNAVDTSYELADPLISLYIYLNKEISMSCARFDRERLIRAQGQLNELGAAFLEVSKADASKPIMVNSQTVYAGLTYGKGHLNENLSDQGPRRGFQA